MSDGHEAAPKRPTRLSTLQQASCDTGIPVNSLRDLVLRGYLPSVRLPGSRRVFVMVADLEAVIERSREVRSD